MGIKRKTEEKKMSMNKNIARLAVTAGLTAALSFGGVMAPVTMAFAVEGAAATANGSVTIEKSRGTIPNSWVTRSLTLMWQRMRTARRL